MNLCISRLSVNTQSATLNKLISLLLGGILLTACQPASRPSTATQTIQPLSVIYTVTPDLTATFQAITPIPSETPAEPSATPTDTPPPPTIPSSPDPSAGVPPTIGACSFNWARKSLPELSEQLLVKINEAGLSVVSASAEAYGEDCLYSDGSLAYFAAMETDYRLTLSVSDLSDTTALADLLTQTLAIIDQFPIKETPGPMPGYIGITFQAGEQVKNLWFQRAKSDELRAQGLSGVNLYEALKAK
jgi:hypothetical protein